MSNFFESFTGFVATIVLAFIFVAGTIYLCTDHISPTQQLEFAKAGLQQCPNPAHPTQTIWLRECLPLK